jgi:hypothetical protein
VARQGAAAAVEAVAAVAREAAAEAREAVAAAHEAAVADARAALGPRWGKSVAAAGEARQGIVAVPIGLNRGQTLLAPMRIALR